MKTLICTFVKIFTIATIAIEINKRIPAFTSKTDIFVNAIGIRMTIMCHQSTLVFHQFFTLLKKFLFEIFLVT